jgi:hypothetical protein
MTDNTIDISEKLPPIEAPKPWRQKLPDCYAKRMDDLKATLEALKTNAAILSAIRRDLREGSSDCRTNSEEPTLDRASDAISATLVLLECATDKLTETVPSEEFMSGQQLAELESLKRPLHEFFEEMARGGSAAITGTCFSPVP